ncbi:hypothetical protein PG997_008942 [Apiospora hydei]|uniref:Rhodopsin domain-containing protein n=1 Tax=Apiospora hydei TaxID=1337664 RepID=A0ABR1WG25_9PEZI
MVAIPIIGAPYVRSRDASVYEDQGPHQSATTTALLVLATFFVCLRFWARYLKSFDYALDDWMLIAALFMTFVTGGLNYGMIANGLGKHMQVVSQDNLTEFFKLLLGFECVYVTAVMLVKLSVLQMYLRIFPSRNFKYTSWAIGAVVIGWWISIVLVCIFQCTPIPKAWNPSLPGHCIDLKASFVGNAIPNIATDIAILAMPVGQVWHLQVNLTQKLSLLFMFLLGSFVLFASIYRFTTIMQWQVADTTWTLAEACTWCVVESACGVISACLPTLRPVMTKISSQWGSLNSSRKNGTRTTGAGKSGLRSGLGFGTESRAAAGETGAARPRTATTANSATAAGCGPGPARTASPRWTARTGTRSTSCRCRRTRARPGDPGPERLLGAYGASGLGRGEGVSSSPPLRSRLAAWKYDGRKNRKRDESDCTKTEHT